MNIDKSKIFTKKVLMKQAQFDSAQVKVAQARQTLQDTDWYIVRHAETGAAIPEDVAKTRAAARDQISDQRGLILEAQE